MADTGLFTSSRHPRTIVDESKRTVAVLAQRPPLGDKARPSRTTRGTSPSWRPTPTSDVLRSTVADLLAIADGGLPHAPVNPEVLGTPRFEAKRAALVARMRAGA